MTGRATRSDRAIDGALGAALAVAVLSVQPVRLMFRRPFWTDEAWVAELVKIPLSRQVALSSSTPIGWALLLRLVPGAAAERLRVVPLVFSVVAVVAAFLFVRGLRWRSAGAARAAAVLAGAAVLLAPISLAQNDLKQYTADAALTLLVFWCARAAEQSPDRRTLTRLAIVCVVATPFSSVIVFVGAAVFAGLLGAAALARDWRRARDVVVTGGVAGAAIVAYIVAVVLPHQNDALRNYWRTFYLDGSPAHAVTTAGRRALALGSSFGVAPKFVLALFVVGLATLALRRHTALAVAAGVLWFEMFVLGVADRYPFLDTRTSYFLLVVTLVVASIGFGEIVSLLTRGRAPLLAVVVIVAVSASAFGVREHMHTFAFPDEDVRTQTLYVAQHQRAGDVVVVNLLANWGFTYYWPHSDARTFTVDHTLGAGYSSRVEGINEVFATGRDRTSVRATVKHALAVWRALGGHGRIWIVRTHLIGNEPDAWTEALTRVHLQPVAMTGGAEPLVVVDPVATRVVSYHGVHVEVPAQWPVVDGMHTELCGGPFPAGATAFVGPQANGAPSCPPALRDPSKPPPDGVWLQPGDRPGDARPLTLPSGATVFEEAARPSGPTEQVWYRGVVIEIAIGPDPKVATAIRNSIGYTAGAPDTPAAGACARRSDPAAMPTPERLTHRLVLNGGNFTLNPPLPTDHPSITAAQAWQKGGLQTKESFERYRIILARYTAKYPAHVGPNGSLVPTNDNELAWVIYSVPTSPEIPGCGGWGLDVFDATTGQEQGISGYSEGP